MNTPFGYWTWAVGAEVLPELTGSSSASEAEMAHALDMGKRTVQGNQLALDVEYDPLDSACHGNAWGFRVVISTNPLPRPLGTKPDGLPCGSNTAYRLTKKPGT